MAVRVRHADIGKEAFPAALRRLLLDGSFAAAARRISVKLRARPRTPTQEAAGACCSFFVETLPEAFPLSPVPCCAHWQSVALGEPVNVVAFAYMCISSRYMRPFVSLHVEGGNGRENSACIERI